ncbi:MAG: hypothetical protein J6R92_04345 [Akkermansia sp.]|nr:hypothetical protein [Akkermansia sp.]
MSPRATFLLTLLGVLLVGIPLPLLTRKAELTPAATAPTESMAEKETTYAAISFTGHPRSIRLRHSGGEWQELDSTLNQNEFELELPKQSGIELEILAEWENTALQAISLTLEPTGREAIMKTLWKEEGSSELHDIMTFTW